MPSSPQRSDDDSGQPPAPMMRLDDVLKRAGWVGSGGQAKVWIQDGQVAVNGQIETRRRKQIFIGDTIEALGQQLVLDRSFFDGPLNSE